MPKKDANNNPQELSDLQRAFALVSENGAETSRQEPPHYHGHRARLREKILRGAGASMADYELLEMILFAANPRADTKPLAKRILAQFDDDFSRAVTASEVELNAVKGVGSAAIAALKTIEAAALRLTHARVIDRDTISSWDALVTYCTAAMVHNRIEQFRILFLDRKNVLIADEAQSEGTVDHVPVYPREVVKRALELRASSIILVHNHPSGDPTPSAADWDVTERVIEACRVLTIEVHDHIIVGARGVYSLRANSTIFD